MRAFLTDWDAELAGGRPGVEAGTVRPAEAPGHGVRLKPGVRDRPDAQRRRNG